MTEDFKRSNYPAGFSRQMAAVMATGDRRPGAQADQGTQIVIHGADDPLVPVEGGRDTAANIAGAELIEIPGMGHDLPAVLYSGSPMRLYGGEAGAPRCVVGGAHVVGIFRSPASFLGGHPTETLRVLISL